MWKTIFMRFKPKSEATRTKLKSRMSTLYAILTWNFAGMTFVYFVNKSLPEDKAERRAAYQKLSSSEEAHVISISGFSNIKKGKLQGPEELEGGTSSRTVGGPLYIEQQNLIKQLRQQRQEQAKLKEEEEARKQANNGQ